MQFPLQGNNDTAVVDGLNYVLSGPGGLGQDFNGYQQWTPGYLTGNFRIPYTQLSVNISCLGVNGDTFVSAVPTATGVRAGMTVSGYGIAGGTTVNSIGSTTDSGIRVNLSAAITADIDNDLTFTPNPLPKLYVQPIALSLSEWIDPYTWKFTFASPQASPPFALGNDIRVYGVNAAFDGHYSPIGVVACTTTYVIAKTTVGYPFAAPAAGGNVWFYSTTTVPDVHAVSTDCNSKIVVNGGNDRVFISAQLNNIISYTATTSSNLNYAVAINRYIGSPNNDPANPGFTFDLDKLITKRVYSYSGLTGTGTLNGGLPIETVFSNFPDVNIKPAYYWYIMDVSFQVTNGGDLQVTSNQLGLRSMSTQTVKQ